MHVFNSYVFTTTRLVENLYRYELKRYITQPHARTRPNVEILEKMLVDSETLIENF